MDQQKIGEFLKTLRKDKNLTQEELADLYDVDMREIFNGERKNETMDKDLKETMLMAADYTDDNMKKVMKAQSTDLNLEYIREFILSSRIVLNK